MAILLSLTQAELFYLASSLVEHCAAAMNEHDRLLSALRTICEGTPFIMSESARCWLIDAITRRGTDKENTDAARAILARLETTGVQA